ncbi:MAG TPA: C40 family peptidase [Ramlibacter sp.]|uniref:C40 family peptidase n=1 Tax=Ramlibacter sp. TaxID=1917967 RepID=UPI002B5D0FEF|nr:C40 family peptidase [Ramlibacter sp.]HVZ43023.1 C40 family peptidase [Ramlibacter sp.]
MSKWLNIWALAACVTAAHAAYAAPPTIADDEVARFLAEKGLLQKWETVRSHVADRVGPPALIVANGATAVAQGASDLVMNAMAFLGVPYRRGGSSAETGFDCSGFVKAIYEQTLGLVLPRRANEQAAATQKIDRGELEPGDLVFFNTMRHDFSHVGIYIGDGKFIHSPRPGAQVRVEEMRTSYWAARFDGARRVLQRPMFEARQAEAAPQQLP